MTSQFGAQIIPLGLDRLKVIEWFNALISLKEGSIAEKMNELKIPEFLLSLIGKYDMNSLLHLKIYTIFNEAMTMEGDAYPQCVFRIS